MINNIFVPVFKFYFRRKLKKKEETKNKRSKKAMLQL